ncbi:MAG: hypothetical protein CM15mP85_31570 [Rhodobacterales bacterium]|nr:MAG: hypothetical protein CM15mP85_31570 [Rhodobacterales bacterium]
MPSRRIEIIIWVSKQRGELLYPSHVHELSPANSSRGQLLIVICRLKVGPQITSIFSGPIFRICCMAQGKTFREVFESQYVQLPLSKGDALFFSPAIFHAAGSNVSSNIHRMANLLQVSSAFGTAMETIDRAKMCVLTYPSILNTLMIKHFQFLKLKAAVAGYCRRLFFSN